MPTKSIKSFLKESNLTKSEAIQILNEKISNCQKCKELYSFRQENEYKTVPGIGNINSKIMIIGEAPGQNEAKEGKPFVGRAGNLLTNILKSCGIEREEIYIANMIKCRPPSNRNPSEEEIDNCRGYLDLQLKVIKPEWIVCLGKIAGQNMTNIFEPMSSLRGRIFEYNKIKMIVTWHPAYILRNPSKKSEVWEDFQPILRYHHGENYQNYLDSLKNQSG